MRKPVSLTVSFTEVSSPVVKGNQTTPKLRQDRDLLVEKIPRSQSLKFDPEIRLQKLGIG